MNRRVTIFWSIFIGLALIRLVFSFLQKPPGIGDCLKKVVRGHGIIAAEPSRTETGQVLVIKTDHIYSNVPGSSECASGILVRVKTKNYPRFSFGDQVEFAGKLLEPFNFKSSSGRSFDYQGYLAKDDIYYEMKSAVVNASIREKNNTWSMTSLLFKLKHAFVSNLDKTLGEPHAALAAGLVVGEKSALGKDLLNDFRTVGLIHVVVLSGFNITIVADAIRRMLSRLPRIWGIMIGGLGIALFGIMVGGGATVIRSCVMAGVALTAQLIRRDYNVVRALIFAGLLMLIQNPMILLHDPSFQLSFLATLGLIMLSQPIEKRLNFIPEKAGLRGIVASTLATQIFVSPYILYMMGQLSIVGAFVNILVLPFIPATMLSVFLTGAAGFLYLPLAEIVGWCTHLLLSYELFMVEHFARLPFAAIALPAFSFWWVIVFYSFFTVFYLIHGRKYA